MTMLRRSVLVTTIAICAALTLAAAGCEDWPHNNSPHPGSDSSMKAGQTKAQSEWHINDAGAAQTPAPAPAQAPAEQPSH
jgi:hypothetical protein